MFIFERIFTGRTAQTSVVNLIMYTQTGNLDEEHGVAFIKMENQSASGIPMKFWDYLCKDPSDCSAVD